MIKHRNSIEKRYKRPAVFLDRDGVLCIEKGYVTQIKELELFPFAKKCMDALHKKGFFVICVTNQSAVARGLMTEKALQKINQYIIKELSLDALYYCPHHPQAFGKYGKTCNCRKPGTEMIERAIKQFDIDRKNSYMVGDRASDILCGQRAGLKTILLESGYGTTRLEQPVYADFIYSNLEIFLQNI